MILLAVDPGSKEAGWAAVHANGARVRFLTSGTCVSTLDAFGGLLRSIRNEADVDAEMALAIEMPEGYIHQPFRGPTLLATARAAGGMSWVAEAWGWRVIELSAASVRKALVGKSTSARGKKGQMDQMVQDAVNANVIGMPKRTNVHTRDALALAIVAGWTLAQKGRAA